MVFRTQEGLGKSPPLGCRKLVSHFSPAHDALRGPPSFGDHLPLLVEHYRSIDHSWFWKLFQINATRYTDSSGLDYYCDGVSPFTIRSGGNLEFLILRHLSARALSPNDRKLC